MIEHQYSDYQTVAEVANDLNVSEKHVRRLIKVGKLTCYRFGSALRIKRKDKEIFEKSCRYVK